MHHLITENALTVFHNKRPLTLLSSDSRWGAAVDLLREGEWKALIDLMQPAKKIAEYINPYTPSDGLRVEGGMIRYNGQPLPGDWPIVKRILSMMERDLPVLPLQNFLVNVLKNPSYRVTRHLIEFIEHGRLPITDDGCFLAYKKVRDNYLDLHSGTYENNVGSLVEMPRNMVDEDPDRTCSSGLHVCSYDYLAHFGGNLGNGFRVIVCKINPADVVAVPNDYNNTKMRVCRYEVVDELEEDANLLADTLVRPASRNWVIQHEDADLYYTSSGEWTDDVDQYSVMKYWTEHDAESDIDNNGLPGVAVLAD